jgi:hypothetical protein
MSKKKLTKYQKEMLKKYPNYFGATFTEYQIKLIKQLEMKENNE